MLHDKMKKLMEKKKKDGSSHLSDVERDAKSSVLDDLKSQAEDAMSSKLHGLNKVQVASDSPEGLKHGLDMAKYVLTDKEHANMVHEAEAGDEPHSMDKMMQEAEEGEADDGSPEEGPESDHAAKQGYEEGEGDEGHENSEDPSEYEGMSEEHINKKLEK